MNKYTKTILLIFLGLIFTYAGSVSVSWLEINKSIDTTTYLLLQRTNFYFIFLCNVFWLVFCLFGWIGCFANIMEIWLSKEIL